MRKSRSRVSLGWCGNLFPREQNGALRRVRAGCVLGNDVPVEILRPCIISQDGADRASHDVQPGPNDARRTPGRHRLLH